MAFEQKDNSGSLFRNDKKESDNHPDYTGSIVVGGVEHWLSAWLKTSASGTTYMSLSVRRKDAKPAQPQKSASKPRMSAEDDNDMIPF